MRGLMITAGVFGIIVAYALMTGNFIAAGLFLGMLSCLTIGAAIGSASMGKQGHEPTARFRSFDIESSK